MRGVPHRDIMTCHDVHSDWMHVCCDSGHPDQIDDLNVNNMDKHISY